MLHMIPAHSTTKGVRRSPKPPLQPDPPIGPHSQPIYGTSSPVPWGAGKGTGDLSSLAVLPQGPQPEFLIWPLINFCYLKKSPRTHAGNKG